MSSSLNIVFYQIGSQCDGSTPREKPLGGTESAMIFMAEALARLGHRVFVFCDVQMEGLHGQVTYRHYRDFEPFALRNSLDVFISIRSLLPLLIKRWAPLQIYLTPDASDQPFLNRTFQVAVDGDGNQMDLSLYSLAYVQKYVDAIFCVGKWQALTMADKFHIPESKLHVVYNGVTLEDFGPGLSLTERKKSIVYASTPFRGLEYLLQYFPEIRARVPDATLTILSGMQIYGHSDDSDQEQYGALYALAKQPGVNMVGPVSKPRMAQILGGSRVMAYPNTFAETFCIAALEAQASGVPVVTSDLAGLKERVSNGDDGYLIAGHPRDPSYKNDFIEKVVSLLSDDILWESMSKKARGVAVKYSYDRLAAQWQELFQKIKPGGLHGNSYFLPQETSLDLLVNGYPRRLTLTGEFITQVYLQELVRFGFLYCAGQVSKMSIKSSNYK